MLSQPDVESVLYVSNRKISADRTFFMAHKTLYMKQNLLWRTDKAPHSARKYMTFEFNITSTTRSDQLPQWPLSMNQSQMELRRDNRFRQRPLSWEFDDVKAQNDVDLMEIVRCDGRWSSSHKTRTLKTRHIDIFANKAIFGAI